LPSISIPIPFVDVIVPDINLTSDDEPVTCTPLVEPLILELVIVTFVVLPVVLIPFTDELIVQSVTVISELLPDKFIPLSEAVISELSILTFIPAISPNIPLVPSNLELFVTTIFWALSAT
jgi:hypothetical protein